jgi:hypothetical protein
VLGRRAVVSRVLAGLGLLLLGTSLASAAFAERGSVGAKAALGAGLLVAAAALRGLGEVRQILHRRGTYFATLTAITACFGVAFVIAANVLVTLAPVSWDLTPGRKFTLTPDTLRTLRGLDREVKALLFFTANEKSEAEEAVRVLEGYARQSRYFRYTVVDPLGRPEEAARYDIRAAGTRIVFTQEDRMARARDLSEESLTRALVTVTRREKRRVYWLWGHGEANPEEPQAHGYLGAARALGAEGFEVRRASLPELRRIPPDAAAVLVVGPRRPFLESELEALRAYLDAGGSLGIYAEPESPVPGAVLEDWGLAFQDEIGSRESLLIRSLGRHPICEGVTNLVLWSARSIAAAQRPGVEHAALAEAGALTLGSAARRPLTGGAEARLLLMGDAGFFSNQMLTAGGNSDFFLNGVAWLARESDRITVRPRPRGATRAVISDGQAALLRFLTIDAIPLALLGLGLVAWEARRRG